MMDITFLNLFAISYTCYFAAAVGFNQCPEYNSISCFWKCNDHCFFNYPAIRYEYDNDPSNCSGKERINSKLYKTRYTRT